MKDERRPQPVAAGPLTALERTRPEASAATIALLHGYGGDERAMWVFETALPEASRAIALRGLYPAEGEGFRWHEGPRWPPPGAGVFEPAVGSVSQALRAAGVAGPVVWVGFSQGAALAFCCAAAGQPTLGIACLAGYLPASLPQLPAGIKVYWSHGVRDRRVPIGQARGDVARLRAWGIEVDLCETESGHRVGAECLRALRTWLRALVDGA